MSFEIDELRNEIASLKAALKREREKNRHVPDAPSGPLLEMDRLVKENAELRRRGGQQ